MTAALIFAVLRQAVHRRRSNDVYRDIAAVRVSFDDHAEQACALTAPAIVAGTDIIRAHTAGRVQRAHTLAAPWLEDLAERRAAADWNLPAASTTALVRTERSN